jgi:hypothetical protein
LCNQDGWNRQNKLPFDTSLTENEKQIGKLEPTPRGVSDLAKTEEKQAVASLSPCVLPFVLF